MKSESNGTDDRSVRLIHKQKFSFICGGKITGIFTAFSEIENEIFHLIQDKSRIDSISSDSSDSNSDHS